MKFSVDLKISSFVVEKFLFIKCSNNENPVSFFDLTYQWYVRVLKIILLIFIPYYELFRSLSLPVRKRVKLLPSLEGWNHSRPAQ